MTGTEQKIKD